MPIVIKWDNIEALGSLAVQAGTGIGQIQNRQLNEQMLARMDQADIARQQLTVQQQQGAFNRQQEALLQAQRIGSQRDLQTQELQTQGQFRLQEQALQNQGGLQRQTLQDQGDIQQQLIGSVLQGARDKQLHAYEMEKIQREAQLGRFQNNRAQHAGLSAQGVPTQQYAESEANDFGNMIPYNVGNAINGEFAGDKQASAHKTALSLSSLPTDQLEKFVTQKPKDPWAPYVSAVVQARKKITGGAHGDTSAQPEGRKMPRQRSAPSGDLGQAPLGQAGSAAGAGTVVDPRLAGLTDDQLLQLAANPQLISQILGGQ